VTSGPEVLRDGTIGRQEPLGLSWRLEPLHPPFPLAGGLMGVFRTVVEIAVLPMLGTGQEVPLCRAVAFQLVCNKQPWRIHQVFEQLKEELSGSVLVPPTLHQNIEDVPFLIHRPPQLESFAANGEKYLI
jgi:hypothetical protein